MGAGDETPMEQQQLQAEDALIDAGQDAEAENQLCSYVKIERLCESGVNVADIAKLKQAGFCTTNSIVSVMRKDLVAVKGLGEAKVDKIIEAAYKTMGSLVLAQQAGQGGGNNGPVSHFFQTAEEALAKHQSTRFFISTGASSLDEVLRGGIESGQITELYGEFRCGKTQLCHTLAVQGQLHEQFPGRCLYIDTEGTFRPDRIQEICQALTVDSDEIMANIITARAMTSEHLNQLLKEACSMMVDESSGQFAIVIIDSIMGLMRQDFTGRGELSERQQLLGKTLNKLSKIAHEFNVAVVLTNQVMADPGGYQLQGCLGLEGCKVVNVMLVWHDRKTCDARPTRDDPSTCHAKTQLVMRKAQHYHSVLSEHVLFLMLCCA
ncbi:unnamed protein product [Amoebophrya sp. A120]|nr:unnamed protein product [Amoebophrya sp. A120]|eukprot:GSA120T00010080001.1